MNLKKHQIKTKIGKIRISDGYYMEKYLEKYCLNNFKFD